MCAIAGTRTFHSNIDSNFHARTPIYRDVIRPARLIEVAGQKRARIVLSDGVGANGNVPEKVLLGGALIQRTESLITAFGALRARLVASSMPPFIVAGRGIPLGALLLVFPHLGIDRSAAAKKLEEKCHSLIGSRREGSSGRLSQRHPYDGGSIEKGLPLERIELAKKLIAFPLHQQKTLSDLLNTAVSAVGHV